MKLKFKHQAYQNAAVEAVADCFAGQPKNEGISYRIDPGRQEQADGHVWQTRPGLILKGCTCHHQNRQGSKHR